MIQYTDTVVDERSQSPIEGAEVYVYAVAENDTDRASLAILYAADGVTEVGNPLTTNNLGVYSFYHPATELVGDVYVGARLRYRSRLFVGGGYSGAAASSAAVAEAVTGPNYANTGQGLAATTNGQSFSVVNAGIVTVYRNVAGVAVEQRQIATTAALAAPAGGEMVGFQAVGDDATAADLAAKARQIVADRDFSTGIAGALTAVRDNGTNAFSGAVEMPNGVSQITAAQSLPVSFARIRGNKGATYWQTDAAESVFEAVGANFVLSSFEGFRTYGGVHGFDISTVGEIASLSFRNLDISQFTGNAFNIAGGLTSCTFDLVGMDGGTGADYGIYSAGGINNDNVVNNCEFLHLTKSAIRMENLTQGLWVNYCRVEHGGLDGQAVFDFEGAWCVRINGGWYEGHHQYLLKLDSASTDGTVIDGIVDIGATDGGGFKASLFDVGTNLIVFGTNVWLNRTTAPLNCLVTGINANLDLKASNTWEHKSGRGGKVHLKARNTIVDTATFDLLTFTRPASTPDTTGNLQLVSGVLTLTYVGLNTGGSIARRTEQWPITVQGVGVAFLLEVGTAYGGNTGNANSVTVVPSEKAGATETSITLQVAVTNAHASLANLIDATFEFNANTNLATNPITVAAA